MSNNTSLTCGDLALLLRSTEA